MEITTYSNFRSHLKSFLDKVFISQSPLYISRNNGEDVVVLSKSDYEAMMETFYLLKSPANAARLMEGIEQYNNGLGKERSLIEE
ncbi:type II toxin-antitoxin system prevent-host-death family antitoxin [Pedobacter sp. MC2016-14]|uniref:type II toxin-antitoxin system Phd/YefM family antitoxin n=1 Tax=Pedobacter sp. MC2016-14 TaxID=2897327 RepID=UPI001E4E941F|nr:type II toxin-antitoxin system prevent-host-death family antitoxin [Pedobacter sp. MC2016-14]MCD0487671.1 type II toxin-antitoxin system prevent-host-death family antitoxin [Pedobacter sp. MC2016-14]